MRFNLIPAGEFLMGSRDSEVSNAFEHPLHRVQITKPFYLGIHEVTQGQYEQVMRTNPSYCSRTGEYKKRVKDFADTSNFPVDNVSWDDAVKFCEKLSELPEEKRAGRVYRLSTEAEWEYSCRGQALTSTPFHFGKSLSSHQANFADSDRYLERLDSERR